MKKMILLLLSLLILFSSCAPAEEDLFSQATALPQEALAYQNAEEQSEAAQMSPQETSEPAASEQQEPEITAEPEINPLTGLLIEDSSILNRRPILIKVENLPRSNRPQYGLGRADLVYEYHTEEGTTRFAALYYGQNSEKIGPIRSGRMFDVELIRMFKAVFVFGSAYQTVLEEYGRYDFGYRLIVEGPNTEPALFRYEPSGKNILMLNSYLLSDVYGLYEIDDTRQDLSGLIFSETQPEGGVDAERVYVRFSSAIYNRWDYDAASKKYLRFCDVENAYSVSEEEYEPLTDSLSGEQIGADNLVVLLAKNFVVAPNIYNIDLQGQGRAFLFREGSVFDVLWVRENPEDVLRLVTADGQDVSMKPGQTWYEVLSDPGDVSKDGDSWRFTFYMPE